MSTLLTSITDDSISQLTAPLDGEATPQAIAAGGSRRPLGQQLIGANLLKPEELERALAEQANKNLPLGETLLEMGAVSEEQLLPYIEAQLGVPGAGCARACSTPRPYACCPATWPSDYTRWPCSECEIRSSSRCTTPSISTRSIPWNRSPG